MAVKFTHVSGNNEPVASPATDSDYGSDIDIDISDYGSDSEIDDATADELFSQSQSRSPVKVAGTVLPSIEQPPSIDQPLIAELEEDVFTHNFSVRLARSLQRVDGAEGVRALVEQIVQGRRRGEAAVEVEYDERNRGQFSPSNPEERPPPVIEAPEKDSDGKKKEEKDTRTPLQRFKKRYPLSVTNLVSPSWCEQQYEFNLSHHGRIPQTKVMKDGSSVHKELEEQVTVEVPVEVITPEDRFGLKLWNTIQGLRSLRTTGLTRELEVWGVLEGEVVNGIIDEVSVECPDVEMEGRVLGELSSQQGSGGKKPQAQLPPDQRTLTQFLTGASQGGSILEQQQRQQSLNTHPISTFSPFPADPDRPHATYYIKDVKTTARASIPVVGPNTRGAHLQLMLYHRMLSSLTSPSTPVVGRQVLERYGLDADASFSDKFIAEIANLDTRAFVSVPDDVEVPPGSQEWGAGGDPLAELLERNSLGLLWELLVEECRRTFPPTPPVTAGQLAAPSSLSPLLTVEYRKSGTPKSSLSQEGVIGSRSFPYDAQTIDGYLRSEIAWWKGERATVGVPVEEAYKCGWCEFAGDCGWRKERVEQEVEKVRLRKKRVAEGGRSGV